MPAYVEGCILVPLCCRLPMPLSALSHYTEQYRDYVPVYWLRQADAQLSVFSEVASSFKKNNLGIKADEFKKRIMASFLL
jgi:hypothetical protein